MVCARLGETLAALHEISADMFGRPATVSSQTVIGSKTNPLDGVAQRFENPLPDTWADDFLHPMLSEDPELTAGILARLHEVSEQIRQGHSVLCHSDLHEKQMICTDTDLAALVDFGEATLLDRHWELGSVLYFHGKENFSSVYDAYNGSGFGRQTSLEVAESFSIAIAMHHASRSRLPGKAHRLAKAADHIRKII